MHSNIGYAVTSSLNLSILLPLAQNPLANNYTLVLYASSLQSASLLTDIQRTNVYWVVSGIWWCTYTRIFLGLEYLSSFSSYLSRAATWAPASRRRTLSHYRLETG